MREFRRKQVLLQPRVKLSRGADGRLRSAGSGDIGDIWAEQKRIRLAEAIEQDRRKAKKKKQRSEPKEVVVKIDLPKLRLPRLPQVKLPKVSRKLMFLAGGAVIVLAVLGITTYSLLGGHKEGKKIAANAAKGLLNAQDQQPEYGTVLPAGKSIEDLGGWARVSPLDKAPVFAYVDTVGGVQVNVSEQPLPDTFKKDIESEVNKLAEQFGANQKFVVGGITVHKGTSAKGPQSVIFVKGDLLLLVKASMELTDEQWVAYISTLQ